MLSSSLKDCPIYFGDSYMNSISPFQSTEAKSLDRLHFFKSMYLCYYFHLSSSADPFSLKGHCIVDAIYHIYIVIVNNAGLLGCPSSSHCWSKSNWCHWSWWPLCRRVLVWAGKGALPRRLLQGGFLQWGCCGSVSWWWGETGELAVDVQADENQRTPCSWSPPSKFQTYYVITRHHFIAGKRQL